MLGAVKTTRRIAVTVVVGVAGFAHALGLMLRGRAAVGVGNCSGGIDNLALDAAHNSTDVGFFSVVTVVEHVIMRVVEGDHAFLTCTSGISVSRSLASVYWTQRNIETYL